MKHAIRLLVVLFLVTGGIALVNLSLKNRQLAQEIDQLETELGRMSIDDPNRVHIVEVETPAVPPEISQHIQRIWQFRCYLPAGYDVRRMSGGGRVAQQGIFQRGSLNTSGSSARLEPFQELLTMSFQVKEDQLEVFVAFGGSSGTSTWNGFDHASFDKGVVVEKLVSSDQGTRSFDQETILPLLKIYDPETAETKEIHNATITTYAGGLIVLYPRSRQSVVSALLQAETPLDYDPSWIATGVSP